jgi:DNA replication and repair protein RecF
MRELAIERLATRGFRNLEGADVELGPRLNVVYGENGQGKTNLLEALYAVATSRSFRTSRLQEIIAHEGSTASVRARVREDGEHREQTVGFRRGVREARIDGKRARSLADYAVVTPVVVFHPGTVALSTGSGLERRRLLDRLALYRQPGVLQEAASFLKAMRARQRVLEARGEQSKDLEHWEELMVRHGTTLSAAREAVACDLRTVVEEAFATLGPEGHSLRATYVRSAGSDLEGFRTSLAVNRARDRARGSASVGPHRDDVALELDGRPVRGVASQGQHRAVVLALELAEISLIAGARGVQPVLLLDDVSSELDRDRTAALLRALSVRRGQLVLTTTRPELIETDESFPVGARHDFRVVDGRIRRV